MSKTLTKFGGVPASGTTGQLLAKVSGTNYDTEWIDPPTGGGGSPTNVIETADFQLDPAGDHPDRCVIVLTGSNSSGIFPYVKLPALANQPDIGYTVYVAITLAVNAGIGVMSNSEDQQYAGQFSLIITYVGDDWWNITSGGPTNPGFLMNLDDPV